MIYSQYSIPELSQLRDFDIGLWIFSEQSAPTIDGEISALSNVDVVRQKSHVWIERNREEGTMSAGFERDGVCVLGCLWAERDGVLGEPIQAFGQLSSTLIFDMAHAELTKRIWTYLRVEATSMGLKIRFDSINPIVPPLYKKHVA